MSVPEWKRNDKSKAVARKVTALRKKAIKKEWIIRSQ